MDLDISTLLVLVIFGFLSAFIDAVVGGGGLISIPALLFTGMSPTAAIATNKLAGTMGSLTSTITFYRSGKIQLSTAGRYFPFVFGGSLLGAWVVHLISPDILKPLMLLLLLTVAVYTIFKKQWGTEFTFKKLTLGKALLFLLVITMIGFYDGFLGPGTGSFLMFAFLTIGFDFLQAAGNAKFLNFGSNIAGLLMFMYLGTVNYTYGLPMGLAMIAGAFAGSKFAIRKGSSFVRILFIVVTLLLLIKNGWDYFTS